MSKKSILIVVAHPDDEMLGMGGTLYRLATQGHAVKILFVTNGNRRWQSVSDVLYTQMELPDQQLTPHDRFTITRWIENELNDGKYDVVITHCENDLNSDHQIVRQSVLVACRPDGNVVKHSNKPGLLLGMKHEIHGFNPNVFLPFSDTYLYCAQDDLNEYDIHKEGFNSLYECKVMLYGTKTTDMYADGFELIYSNSGDLIF